MWNLFAQVDQAAVQDQLSKATAQQEQMFEFVEKLQGMLMAYLPFLIGGVVIVFVFFLMNAVNKMRVDKAILRIDKNLEKLVTRHELSKDTPHNPMYGPSPSSVGPTAVNATVNAESATPKKDWYE